MKSLYQERSMHELCEITSSKRIFAADYQTEGVPFFRGKEITERFNGAIGVSTELFISRQKFEEIKAKFGVPKVGDLLLTSVGTLGSTYVVHPGDEFYFKDGNITWFRNFKGLNSTYLHYWLSSPAGKSEQKKCTIGSSQSAYTIVLLKEMKIALPPLEEQERIASILSAYDDLIENNTRRIAILEEMARRIYEEWFVRFRFPEHEQVKMVESELGLIPEGWQVTSLQDYCSIVSRGVTPKYQPGSGRFVINQKANRGSELLFSELKELMTDLVVPAEKYARFGDVLVNSLGEGTIGRVHYFSGPDNQWAVDQHMTICRCRDVGAGSVLYQYLSSEAGQAKIASVKTGATSMTMLNISSLRDFDVLRPPLQIIQKFWDLCSSNVQLKAVLQQKNANLRATRDLLLPKLISGEIDVSTLPEPEEAIAA